MAIEIAMSLQISWGGMDILLTLSHLNYTFSIYLGFP